MDSPPRRPIAARQTKWAAFVSGFLIRSGLKPNGISVLSVIMSTGGGVCFLVAPRISQSGQIACLIGGAAFIQFRLLCNLFDGMVAIEGGFKSKVGELYNDFPDRLSDSLILVSIGYSIPSVQWGHALGWAAALLSALTAYVRILGGSVAVRQCFAGPMAKQHRMAVVTVAAFLAALESGLQWSPRALAVALVVICAGCVITICRRLRMIASELNSRA